jgi:hypothetical protein
MAEICFIEDAECHLFKPIILVRKNQYFEVGTQQTQQLNAVSQETLLMSASF